VKSICTEPSYRLHRYSKQETVSKHHCLDSCNRVSLCLLHWFVICACVVGWAGAWCSNLDLRNPSRSTSPQVRCTVCRWCDTGSERHRPARRQTFRSCRDPFTPGEQFTTDLQLSIYDEWITDLVKVVGQMWVCA